MAELIVGHRDRIGSRWRALNPGRQALLVLVHLRCNEMRIAARKAYVILEGTLAPTDRLSGAGDRLYFSGKHHRHGVHHAN